MTITASHPVARFVRVFSGGREIQNVYEASRTMARHFESNPDGTLKQCQCGRQLCQTTEVGDIRFALKDGAAWWACAWFACWKLMGKIKTIERQP